METAIYESIVAKIKDGINFIFINFRHFKTKEIQTK